MPVGFVDIGGIVDHPSLFKPSFHKGNLSKPKILGTNL
jgi:hypothetical protein